VHAATYRIAVGPQEGRKVFTLKTLPDERDADGTLATGNVAGLLRASCPPPFGPALSRSKSLPAILSPCTPVWQYPIGRFTTPIYTERYLGAPKHNPEGYAASSVFPYSERLKSPLLIMHGMADDVLFTNSTKLFKALQSSQRDFDTMPYPGSKHGLLRHPETGPHTLNMILRYFKDHLQD